MRFNVVRVKTALLVTGKTQLELAQRLELSRRGWELPSMDVTLVKRPLVILRTRWVLRWMS